MKYRFYIPLLFFCSCYVGSKGFYTHPSKQDYKRSVNLKMDGSYYTVIKYTGSEGPGEVKHLFFLYKNGVAGLLRMGFFTYGNRDSLGYDTKSVNREYDDFIKGKFRVKPYFEWGGYKAENGQVVIQIVRSVSGPAFEWCTFKGDIVNDSLIYIRYWDMMNRSDYCDSNFLLQFNPMEKPDSINRWMGKSWYWAKE